MVFCVDVAGFGLSASVFTGKQSKFGGLEPIEEDYQDVLSLLNPGTKTDDDLEKDLEENINKQFGGLVNIGAMKMMTDNLKL